jgi:hypothetical protein
VKLWGVVENGFHVIDERNMSPQEKVNCQLNSPATDKIHQSLKHEIYDQVVDMESTKELWDKLTTMFEGTMRIDKGHRCKMFEIVN